ncbi:4-oxalocrotonate tautomerase family protein [Castellaniella ginsengisoli]|uniref:4-oxalocrotonate tautomerase family protein n=1 Tax=Castellaniella ginsengisoli TaxID=546114 RepID=A0AB39DC13_9BURK
MRLPADGVLRRRTRHGLTADPGPAFRGAGPATCPPGGFRVARTAGFFYSSFFHSGDRTMPYVNIKITREGATVEQKARLIEGATQLLVDVLGKNPKTTFVVIEEVDTDNWGIAGEPVTAIRARAKASASG